MPLQGALLPIGMYLQSQMEPILRICLHDVAQQCMTLTATGYCGHVILVEHVLFNILGHRLSTQTSTPRQPDVWQPAVIHYMLM